MRSSFKPPLAGAPAAVGRPHVGPSLVAVITAIAALLFFASTAHGGLVFTGKVTEIDGRDSDHVQFPTSEAAVSFRPTTASQKSLVVENYYIHNLTNQKALDIRATRRDDGLPAWAYSSITLRNLKIHDIERREDLPGGNGLHIDHVRIAGGGNSQDVKTNILIENLDIAGGDALPILITDGVYGTITIRNVTIKDTTLNNIQFKTDKVGSIDKIVIENSPDIGVALIGRPGSVKEVIVRNSPDIRVGDTLSSAGRTGAKITIIDGAAVPEPAMLAPFALGWIALTSRRRRRRR
jgi:hypothetical protein